MPQKFPGLLLLICACGAFGQATAIDLHTQSRNVDFSDADSTRPFKSGTGLPSNCAVGEIFYKTDAPAGANVYGCVAANAWALEGGGLAMLGQAGDLLVVRTNATTLTIGAGCSPATPCNVRFGNLVYSVISSATSTIAGGTGAAFVYLSSSGVITVGHNLTVTCSANCVAQSGVTSFPPDSIPVFTWSASSGAWDPNGGTDLRAFTSTAVIQPGAGMTSTVANGKVVLGADAALIGIRTAVPASSTDACVTGSWAMDGSFYYLCVSSGGWRRAALSSW